MSEASGSTLLAEGLLMTDGIPEPGDRIALAASTCPSCHRTEFPVRDSCPSCGAATTTVALSTSCRVAGFTAVNHPPPGAVIAAPYVVAVGDFPEGISILGPVPGATFEELDIGDGMETIAIDIGGRIGYGFRLS
jgi:uncharacterized OB-fold protein